MIFYILNIIKMYETLQLSFLSILAKATGTVFIVVFLILFSPYFAESFTAWLRYNERVSI